jgi:hypothetical protein
MKTNKRESFTLRPLAAALSIMFFATGVALAGDMKVTLAGDQEVPAVKTDASGNGTITVNADKTVSGSVTVKGVNATAAHIHEGAAGKNGGVIIPLTKSGDTFSVPAAADRCAIRGIQKGELYVNVRRRESERRDSGATRAGAPRVVQPGREAHKNDS